MTLTHSQQRTLRDFQLYHAYISRNWKNLEVPDILFLIVHPTEPTILNYCHNLLELFRLRDQFNTHDARVYRFKKVGGYSADLYARWSNEQLKWIICDVDAAEAAREKVIPFEWISYGQLEVSWQLIRSLQ